jgi:putative N6-adenine-specific DNA methylase
MIVANPPYGKRMGEVKKLGGFYRRFGDRAQTARHRRHRLAAGRQPRARQQIGLRTARRIPLFNGPIECRLLKFELYEGSRKPPHARSFLEVPRSEDEL